MRYQQDLGGTRYVFADLKTLLARATPHRSGDVLAGIAAASATERVAAQMALADLPLRRSCWSRTSSRMRRTTSRG